MPPSCQSNLDIRGVIASSRMTLENLLSQMGTGTKQLTDRYSGEYGAPVNDQHVYYAYEPSPPSHAPVASSKHHYSSSGGLKSNASMSALTLLAFLFFLHILQQCIKEHMIEMNTTPVVVMSASREGNDAFPVTSKIDKTGQIDNEENSQREKYETNPYKTKTEDDENMMKINAAEHKPVVQNNIYGYTYKNNDRNLPGFINAMNNN